MREADVTTLRDAGFHVIDWDQAGDPIHSGIEIHCLRCPYKDVQAHAAGFWTLPGPEIALDRMLALLNHSRWHTHKAAGWRAS